MMSCREETTAVANVFALTLPYRSPSTFASARLSCMSRTFLALVFSPSNVKRSIKTALVVGPMLALINQTGLLWRLAEGEILPVIALLRISLTFLVPFGVALYSSAMADRAREAKEEDV